MKTTTKPKCEISELENVHSLVHDISYELEKSNIVMAKQFLYIVDIKLHELIEQNNKIL